jgi:AraC-like DNA-binding protein
MASSYDPIEAGLIDYRPRIIEGGYRKNPKPGPIRAGWPWASERWRIWQVLDGVLTWQHGKEVVECRPRTCVIQQGDRIASHMLASPGSHWGQLRFALFPADESGDADSAAVFGASIPLVLTPEQSEELRSGLADIFAWWWRDPWHLLRAETRLAGLLVATALQWRALDDEEPRVTPVRKDLFAAADDLWRTRPLAPQQDLAAACGMSVRTFRRRFHEIRGTSPSAYARTHMASLACDLLRDRPDWSVAQIGKYLGYAHTSTFVRAFRAELSQAPEQWRRGRQRGS